MNTIKSKSIVKQSVKRAVIYCGSQAALARRAGITQGAIGKYLRGETLPTGVTANNLSKAVDNTMHNSDFAPHIFTQECKPDIFINTTSSSNTT
jgi:transcriptional regulator with XRE-family HTH domain